MMGRLRGTMPLCHSCHKDFPAGTTTCPHCGVAAKVTTGAGNRTQHFGSQPPAPAQRPPLAASPPASAGASVAPAASAAQARAQPQQFAPGDLTPGTVVGEYRVEGKLGEGGMGAVYSATHPLIGKKAAIKVISAALCTDSAQVERFVQEARSVNQIGHPNIVDVFAFGTLPDGRSYFVMEWLQGQSLAERVAKGGMTLPEAVEIMEQASDALEAAHEKGIVHRDLKPDNVYLVNVRGNRQLVKLLDFGIAKLASGGDVRVQKTATGMMMGTPGYISPEQARGKSDVDHRTDVYAFGCMAYEMILGRLPFVAESAMDVVIKHLTEAPPTPSSIWPEIPPPLEAVLLRMLDKEPSRRPSLIEFRAILNELRGFLMSTMGPDGSKGFRSGFGPRPVTPAGQKWSTPVPGSTPAVSTGQVQRPVTPVPGSAQAVGLLSTTPLSTMSGASPDASFESPAKAGGKGKWIALGGVLVAGGVAAVLVLGGGKKNPAPVAAPAPPPVAVATPPVEPAKPPEKPADPPVAVATPPVAAKGKLVVNVDAADATIELDGKKIASATNYVAVDLDEGDHKLVVSAPGRKPNERTVTIAQGASATADVKLDKIHTSGSRPAGDVGKKPTDTGKKPDDKKGGQEDGLVDPFGRKK
jgi:serine/threonine protein kinase